MIVDKLKALAHTWRTDQSMPFKQLRAADPQGLAAQTLDEAAEEIEELQRIVKRVKQ